MKTAERKPKKVSDPFNSPSPLTADEVLFVGDSEADAQTAAAAGLIFVGWGVRFK
jgi:phosphoglycolate phosphatase-like HAD superfamily hydrolase